MQGAATIYSIILLTVNTQKRGLLALLGCETLYTRLGTQNWPKNGLVTSKGQNRLKILANLSKIVVSGQKIKSFSKFFKF